MPIVVGLYLAGAAAARAAALAHREPRDAAGDRPSLVMNQMKGAAQLKPTQANSQKLQSVCAGCARECLCAKCALHAPERGDSYDGGWRSHRDILVVGGHYPLRERSPCAGRQLRLRRGRPGLIAEAAKSMDTFDLVSKERIDTLRPACRSCPGSRAAAERQARGLDILGPQTPVGGRRATR
eukprot:scaffold109141_cov36-Phaeocystis_antarctica.AAC.3